MIEKGASNDEVEVVGYLPHTMTVEPFDSYDYEYYHLDELQKGVYYVVSPKIGLNKVSGQINSPLTWTLDAYALAKCDFGAHNSRMATFLQVFLEEWKRFVENDRRCDEMPIRFGRFFEDDHPLMMLGPLSKNNKDRIAVALQVLPHYWIHGLFWRGPSKRCPPEESIEWKCDDFYAVVMEDDDDNAASDGAVEMVDNDNTLDGNN